MSWREAYLRQARSDNDVRKRLNDPAVPYSHRLHYLQMMSEKLAKGLSTESGSDEPAPASHHALVRMLQTLKTQPHLRRQLGYDDPAVFRGFIDSLLELAGRVERLAPSAAGMTQPNPEYPWRDGLTGEVWAPTDYEFSVFDPRDPKMIKLERLLDGLLRWAD